MPPEYIRVQPTIAEVEAWRRKDRKAPPHRVACQTDGVRFWLSGIGLGSHRRSMAHAHGLGRHDHNESTFADRCPVCRDATAGEG